MFYWLDRRTRPVETSFNKSAGLFLLLVSTDDVIDSYCEIKLAEKARN
jgi:hypothetical protein